MGQRLIFVPGLRSEVGEGMKIAYRGSLSSSRSFGSGGPRFGLPACFSLIVASSSRTRSSAPAVCRSTD